MPRPSHHSPTTETLVAALSGGFAAIIGGMVFIGALILLDVHGLRSLASADGWIRALAQLGGVVGCFGILGFATGPMLMATSRKGPRRR